MNFTEMAHPNSSQACKDFYRAYSDVPILGLSAAVRRYLDKQRNVAHELLADNITSEMTPDKNARTE